MNVSLCFYVHVSVTWLHVAFKFIHKKAETILLRYSRRWVTALQGSEMLTRGCSHGTPTKKYPLCYFVYGREKHKRCTVRVRRQASVSCRTHQGYCIITIFLWEYMFHHSFMSFASHPFIFVIVQFSSPVLSFIFYCSLLSLVSFSFPFFALHHLIILTLFRFSSLA